MRPGHQHAARNLFAVAVHHPDLGSFALNAEELHEELALASGDVSELDRQVLFLHHVEGRTIEEIARVLGIASALVRMRLRRGRRVMRQTLFPELSTSARS